MAFGQQFRKLYKAKVAKRDAAAAAPVADETPPAADPSHAIVVAEPPGAVDESPAIVLKDRVNKPL